MDAFKKKTTKVFLSTFVQRTYQRSLNSFLRQNKCSGHVSRLFLCSVNERVEVHLLLETTLFVSMDDASVSRKRPYTCPEDLFCFKKLFNDLWYVLWTKGSKVLLLFFFLENKHTAFVGSWETKVVLPGNDGAFNLSSHFLEFDITAKKLKNLFPLLTPL